LYQKSDAEIAITEIEGKLIPPVIFNPICISGIIKLEGDRGARSIIEDYRYETYKVIDKRLLMDIDTPEDFMQLKKAYNCA
jgi:CTP:molybdopterin cytidylyltransferase MocA